jgi:hypothetical protein
MFTLRCSRTGAVDSFATIAEATDAGWKETIEKTTGRSTWEKGAVSAPPPAPPVAPVEETPPAASGDA